MSSASVTLRPATLKDVAVLERWDRAPHVIAATSDDPGAKTAFGDHDWRQELARQSEFSCYFIAEVDGRPIGAMQIIDPQREPEHYWGDIEANLRAVDIWIGELADTGKGYGRSMMRLALQRCFAAPEVTAVVIDPLGSNTRAHRFYQRLGFKVVGPRRFGEDNCLVHKLARQDWREQLPEG
jgi:aminoglycoside 6'-N-acetyltransferase